jgi:peptide/nickel transport system ATP-binding protein
MSKYILEIKNLKVQSINGAVLVDHVSLNLMPGEVLGLIGESGAGKSTIGLAAMAFARAGCCITDGEIILNGVSLLEQNAKTRQAIRGTQIAYIAQSAAASFNPAHTLMDQICEMPVTCKMMTLEQACSWAIELFTALDLPDPQNFGNRYPHQVSGGQLQRAMTAMAMSCRPSILVLDEPTTALDVTTQIEVLVLLKKLMREYGMAALYITHDLAVVAQVSDRIKVLRHGKTVEDGTAVQILQQPQQEYTKALVAERQSGSSMTHFQESASAEPLLKIENVEGAYGSVTCLSDISIDVMRGETVAVVGESGSGKSSLARLVAGLVTRIKGDVRINGKSLSAEYGKRSREELRKIQLIYQLPDVALNPRQTIGEIIGRVIQFYFKASDVEVKSGVNELLKQVGLPLDFAQRLPSALSGGQKQRVCIARALAAKPELIICDEPTSALDPLVANDILNLLKNLQDDLGISYLFITHDLGVVRRIAHRTVVLFKGKIVTQGVTEAVFSPPFHPYTEKLIHSVPEMDVDWLDHILEQRAQSAVTTS